MHLFGRSRFKKNALWVLFGNIVHAAFQFGVNILAARVLLPADYGLINYASSIVTLFVAISTIGFHGTITKKFAENEDRAGKYLWSTTIAKFTFAIPLILICLLAGYLHAPEDADLQKVMFCQALTILFSSCDLFIYWFRYKYKASVVAAVRLIAFGLSAAWRLVALLLLKSTSVYVLGTACETAFLGVILLLIYKKMQYPKLCFDKTCLREMLQISYPFIFSAMLTTIYGQVDKIMLKMLLDSEAVAYYSVSLTLAGAISIIPSAIIEGFRPEIMREKERNEQAYQKRMRQAYFSVFWICVAYCLFITIFAKKMVLFLYGETYLGAVDALSLIVWYTSFSYFGAINNIYMVAEHRAKWVQISTLFGVVINIVLNSLLIPGLGIMGAAAASLITQVAINNLLLLFAKPLRKCFFLQIKGIFNVDCFSFGKLLH